MTVSLAKLLFYTFPWLPNGVPFSKEIHGVWKSIQTGHTDIFSFTLLLYCFKLNAIATWYYNAFKNLFYKRGKRTHFQKVVNTVKQFRFILKLSEILRPSIYYVLFYILFLVECNFIINKLLLLLLVLTLEGFIFLALLNQKKLLR